MGDPGININLGDSLPYLEQRFLKFIGKDEASKEAAVWFSGLQKTALTQVANVHCLGMHRPLPFASIYQPTRILLKGRISTQSNTESFAYANKASRSILLGIDNETRSIGVNDFLESGQDAIVYAGPGWGKTTFLHYVFRKFIENENVLPVLITLRRPTALDDLERFADTASKVQSKQKRDRTLLLVDGYDELPIPDRKRVSEALLSYQSHGNGNFILSCREYYQVYQVVAREVRIDRFSREDTLRFVRAFLAAFSSILGAEEVVDELESRGFSEFLSHPLLLALACIVKTSSSSMQPRSALRLLERALEVLCYRWDEHKAIDRQPLTPLDGQDRIQVLKRIAYHAKSSHLPQSRAEAIARKQIDLLTTDRVDARQVLMETAQFYGILVPTDDGWEFVHRTLHDFLAAQFWVETGEFAKVEKYEWNSRTAYAACRMMDSTPIVEAALSSVDGLPALTEILSNAPNFDMKRIADCIVKYFSKPGLVQHFESDDMHVLGSLSTDFVRLASTRFLNVLIEKCSPIRGKVADMIVAYCVFEMNARNCPIDFQTYAAALAAYKSDRFTFRIAGIGEVQLSSVNPARPRFQRR